MPSPTSSATSSDRASPAPLLRVAESADADRLDAWLAVWRPLPVPESRARRLALEALLAQSGQGVCVMREAADGTNPVRALMAATLIHHLTLAGRVAMVADWWCDMPGSEAARESFDACIGLLADWCRAHGIRHLLAAPTLLPEAEAPQGFVRDASGLWRRDCMPAAKLLG